MTSAGDQLHPPGRSRHRRVVYAFALAVLVILLAMPSAQALPFAKELRVWGADNPGSQTFYFKLNSDEDFTHYVFRVTPKDDIPLSVGMVEVKNLHGDLQCRGIVTYHLDTLSVVRHCPDLRLDHNYQLTWITDRPGTQLKLLGY